MQANFEREALIQYERAYRLGQRQYSQLTARGERGTLVVMDELTEEGRIMAYVRQPTREISLGRVVGTYTSARAHSFSAGFMPLHPLSSEFASKWISLCAIHMSEGLRDPVEVYEYLWKYYVVEGNKRVSVLKHFGAASVRAEITRLIPQLDSNDPDTATYYAFLHYDKDGLFKNIQLSSAQRYQTLRQTELRLLSELGEGQEPLNFNAMYLRFEGAYEQAQGKLLLGDAFLEYLKVYGFIIKTPISELTECIRKLQPQLVLAENPGAEPTILMDVQEEAPQSFVSRLFSAKKTADVLFVYEPGRTEKNWIGEHEKGRLRMQRELGESVRSSCLDQVTPDNAYEMLTQHAAGANLLLVTSTRLAPATLRFSLEHPDCLTLIYSRVRQDYRLNTYYGRYYEPVFLCGVAAGLGTLTGRVAYVTPHIESRRHTSDINAFGLGVKSVRPDAHVYLMMKDVMPDESGSAAHGIRHAVELGCDIALVPDYPGLAMVGPPEGSFSYLLRLHGSGAPSEYLASPAWDWGRYYTQIVKSYLNNSLDMLRIIDRDEPTAIGLWWGLGTGALEFKTTNFLPPTANNLLHYLRSSIQLGRFNPFHGPIYDQAGENRIAKHSDPKPYEILNMDWVADFVEIIL
ncbi:MAG: BMP family ABC transporter substrate-binding protein [Christensenellales bacterium]